MLRSLACPLALLPLLAACGVAFQAVEDGPSDGSAGGEAAHGTASDVGGGGNVGGGGGLGAVGGAAGAGGEGGLGSAEGGGGGAGDAGGGGAGGSASCEAGSVACFLFDGNALDTSPQDNHAVASDVSWVAGKAGQAISLGPSSSLIVPTHPSFGLSAYTMQAWIRPTSLPSGTERMALVDAAGRWSMWLYADGLRCRGISGAAVPVGVWTHVACVHDGAELRVFVDGVQVGAGANSLDATPPLEAIHLGSDAPAGGDAFLGEIDALRIHDQASSATEICAAAGGAGC